MGDARSLLRNERVLRRIDHPNASYSVTGTLECTVCHIPVKSDIEAWNKHLTSSQHAMRAERLRIIQSKPPNRFETSVSIREFSDGSKKRKASEDGEDSRKRTRPVVKPPSGFFNEEQVVSREYNPSQSSDLSRETTALVKPQEPVQQSTEEPINEEEWAAFERDVATSPPPADIRPSALVAQATISAAPISAAELAAQETKGERALGREKREAEIEAEKEDAARLLEEELDELEGLDERVRLLRARREALRMAEERREGEIVEIGGTASEHKSEMARDTVNEEENSDDEDFDDWRFGN